MFVFLCLTYQTEHNVFEVHDVVANGRTSFFFDLGHQARACLLSHFSHVQLFTSLWTVASSVHGILQARILEWVAMPSSRGSSWPRDRTHIYCCSCIASRFFYHWATGEALAIRNISLHVPVPRLHFKWVSRLYAMQWFPQVNPEMWTWGKVSGSLIFPTDSSFSFQCSFSNNKANLFIFIWRPCLLLIDSQRGKYIS